MGHIRMLGLCLTSVLAVSAVTAGQALAKEKCTEYKNQYGEVSCETTKEHSNWQTFANCPIAHEGVETCIGGESFYRETWKTKQQQEEYEEQHGPTRGLLSHFTTGNVTVPLKASITLRGGLEEVPETGRFTWIAASGAATIEPVAQKAIPLTKGVNKALLSPGELERYDYYVYYAKQTKTFATVELAGPAEQIQIAIGNQLAEEGTAFVFPVKVKLTNPFLGETCYVGSNSSPIDVPFTTGQSGELHGKLGKIEFPNSGDILTLWGETLVSSEFSSPGVEGCGVEGGADAAVDSALGLPSPSGNTSVLNGVLKLTGRETLEEVYRGEV